MPEPPICKRKVVSTISERSYLPTSELKTFKEERLSAAFLNEKRGRALSAGRGGGEETTIFTIDRGGWTQGEKFKALRSYKREGGKDS